MEPAARLTTLRPPRPTTAGLAAMVVAAGFVAFVALRVDHASTSAPPAPAPAATEPESAGPPATASKSILTRDELRSRVRALKQPVYWAGPQEARAFELARGENGSIEVRYVQGGATSAESLLVATYPAKGAYANARRAVREQPALIWTDVRGGGIAVYDPDRPTSVYVAFPGVPYQIEVFDPSPERVRELVVSGAIRPVIPRSAASR